MTGPDVLFNIVADIEQKLATFYRFPLAIRAQEFLVLAEQNERRAQVLLRQNQDELCIAVSFQTDFVRKVELSKLDVMLNDSNLDLYCAVVEEISHFHMIVNRARMYKPVSRLELEWHAEIDKFLLSAHRLASQDQDPHLLALTHKLYQTSKIIDWHDDLYWIATKYASWFWKDHLPKHSAKYNPFECADLQKLMRSLYSKPWHDKILELDMTHAA